MPMEFSRRTLIALDHIHEGQCMFPVFTASGPEILYCQNAVLVVDDEGLVFENDTLNEATSTKRLTVIPKDVKAYPRSKKLYTQLQKDAKLCQNRGGQVLADVWGNLMVYGTVPGQEPCGQINMANYFEQAADRPRDKKM